MLLKTLFRSKPITSLMLQNICIFMETLFNEFRELTKISRDHQVLIRVTSSLVNISLLVSSYGNITG